METQETYKVEKELYPTRDNYSIVSEYLEIPLSKLKPNPWNPNQMNKSTFAALKRSIQDFSKSLSLVVVREKKDYYEIVDGFHRCKAIAEINQANAIYNDNTFNNTKKPIITHVACVVIDCSDDDAKLMTQVLNRTRGTDDPQKYKELLESLSLEPDDIMDKLPDEGDLDDLIASLDSQIKAMGSIDLVESDFRDDNNDDNNSEKKANICPSCGYEFY